VLASLKVEQKCALVINLLLWYLSHNKRRYLWGSSKSYNELIHLCE